MANFPIQAARVATAIGRMIHFLDDIDGQNINRNLNFFIQVLDQNGKVMRTLPDEDHPSNDERPYLTAQQINQLIAFMDSRRTALPTDLNFDAGNIVGRCTWRFRDEDGTNPGRSLHARVIELDAQGGFVRRHQFNDQPHLSAAQTNAALAFLTTQRGKAVAEIL